jgi:acyl-CoA reductase-like NAD-dependent aldehyde dehydrogenase
MLGPLITEGHRHQVEMLIEGGLAEGAKLLK